MSSIPDERLALLFTCCHPALAVESRVALTLREVGGLATARDRARVPRRRAGAGPAARSRQAAGAGHGDPVPRPARSPPSRPRARRAARPLPRLQRGVRGDRRRGARAPRALRRGDPARQAPLRPDARRAGGIRSARAPPPAGLTARRAPRPRRRARAARRTGSTAVGPPSDRRGPPRPAPRGGAASPRPVPAPGRHRRRSRRRRRSPHDRRCVRRPRAIRPLTRRASQPGGCSRARRPRRVSKVRYLRRTDLLADRALERRIARALRTDRSAGRCRAT